MANPSPAPAATSPLRENKKTAGDINASDAIAAKERKRGQNVGRRCTGGGIRKTEQENKKHRKAGKNRKSLVGKEG